MAGCLGTSDSRTRWRCGPAEGFGQTCRLPTKTQVTGRCRMYSGVPMTGSLDRRSSLPLVPMWLNASVRCSSASIGAQLSSVFRVVIRSSPRSVPPVKRNLNVVVLAAARGHAVFASAEVLQRSAAARGAHLLTAPGRCTPTEHRHYCHAAMPCPSICRSALDFVARTALGTDMRCKRVSALLPGGDTLILYGACRSHDTNSALDVKSFGVVAVSAARRSGRLRPHRARQRRRDRSRRRGKRRECE